jgi:carbohydrate kinase (thermoresistant glucokinase family)
MANRLVLMGVTGCGKTTLGKALQSTGYAFVDADDLHPEANRRKMAAGEPLTDADRLPWLEAVAAQLRQWRENDIAGALACSALKRSYRDLLRDKGGPVGLIYLRSTPTLSLGRLANRTGHFMPATLVDSQFATLEEPAPDEDALVLEADAPVADQVADILAASARAEGS